MVGFTSEMLKLIRLSDCHCIQKVCLYIIGARFSTNRGLNLHSFERIESIVFVFGLKYHYLGHTLRNDSRKLCRKLVGN
jgi:hypothetical protein